MPPSPPSPPPALAAITEDTERLGFDMASLPETGALLVTDDEPDEAYGRRVADESAAALTAPGASSPSMATARSPTAVSRSEPAGRRPSTQRRSPVR